MTIKQVRFSFRPAILAIAIGLALWALMTITAGAAMAQNGVTCAYANDDLNYVNGANTVDGYMVTTSSQTYLPPVLTGGQSYGASFMSDIIMSPTKDILYVADSHTGDVAAMKSDPGTCQLTLLGTFPVGLDAVNFGMGLAISPNGKWLYAVGVKSQELEVLAVRNNGTLTGVKQKITLLNRPSSMSVSPDSATLVVGIPSRPKNGNEAISYAINQSTGMLAQVSATLTDGAPAGIAIDSQSKFVYIYVLDADATRVTVLEIGTGSSLTFLRTYSFAESPGTFSLSGAILGASGKYLYVTNPDIAALTTLEVNSATGALKYITTTPDGIMGSESPTGLATTSNNAFVFTGDNAPGNSPNMGIFGVGRGGLLTSLGTFPLAQGEASPSPQWVAAKDY